MNTLTPSPDFIAIDVEYADDNKYICQFGLVVVRDGQIVGEPQTWLIQPPDNIYGERQMQKHHITPEMTLHSPTFPEVWSQIEPLLRGQQLWAHNKSTERDALEATLGHYHIPHDNFNLEDSIHLYRRTDRTGWNHGNSLRACAYAIGLPCENHHDAGADALMCAQIVLANLNGKTPDWQLSDRLMTEYNARKHQTQQLSLFDSFDDTAAIDGTDHIDLQRLNTADTNPLYGASIVLTGYFHIRRSDLREALKHMGASLKQTVTKNVQAVLIGERNAGPAKLDALQTLIHNGYNIAQISGDDNLDRLLYDCSLTPSSFAIPQSAKKDLNFTIAHFRRHHHRLEYPVNSIASKELYFPPSGFMGRNDLFCQMCGNLGSFGNWDYNPQVNIVVLPNASVEALQRGEKDEVIRAFEAYYNSQRSVTFSAEFITERDILKFVRKRIVRCSDDVTGQLYALYLQSAAIDPETDFKYGLKVARDDYEKELQNQGE